MPSPVEFQRYSERKQVGSTAPLALVRAIKVRSLGLINGVQNWLVRGEKIRNRLDVDFCMGSHDAHSAFIPPNEIWVEVSLSLTDLAVLLVHEGTERFWMTTRGWSYEYSHDRSSMFERALRKKIESGQMRIRSTNDAVFVAKAALRKILAG